MTLAVGDVDEDVRACEEHSDVLRRRGVRRRRGDADDRTVPDQVTLEPARAVPDTASIMDRFSSVSVRQVVMSKLHTGACVVFVYTVSFLTGHKPECRINARCSHDGEQV